MKIRRVRLPGGSVEVWTDRVYRRYDADRNLVEIRPVGEGEGPALSPGDAREAYLTRAAVDSREEAVAAAAARLTEIRRKSLALADAPPLAPSTNAQALAAIRTLDTRQREIADALGDMARILRAVGLAVAGEEG
jgi:hypothetical protein